MSRNERALHDSQGGFDTLRMALEEAHVETSVVDSTASKSKSFTLRELTARMPWRPIAAAGILLGAVAAYRVWKNRLN